MNIKSIKIFLAIYLPVFVTTGILLRNSPLLKPFGYIFSAITLVAIGYVFYHLVIKKKK